MFAGARKSTIISLGWELDSKLTQFLCNQLSLALKIFLTSFLAFTIIFPVFLTVRPVPCFSAPVDVKVPSKLAPGPLFWINMP